MQEEKAHKRFGPSTFKRLFLCPGSLRMIEALPKNEQKGSDTIHSRRGTTAHAVGEMVISSHISDQHSCAEADDYEGMTVEGVMVDSELVYSARVYSEHCISELSKFDYAAVERKFTLEGWEPAEALEGEKGFSCFDVGGTMDFLGCQSFGLLSVKDLKNGQIPVNVIDNPQLLAYCLLALINLDDEFDFLEVETEIVQPLYDHPNGPIRKQVLTPDDIYYWGEYELLPRIMLALSDDAPIVPGEEQCMWCQAQHKCPEKLKVLTEKALVEFEDDIIDGSTSIHIPKVEFLTPEQRILILEHKEELENFFKAVVTYEHQQAESGNPPKGFKLVAKRGRRKFKKTLTEADLKKELKRLGLSAHDYSTEPQLKSPAQIEETLKQKGAKPEQVSVFFQENVEMVVSGTNLVHESNPKPAIANTAQTDFLEDINDDLLEY